MTPPGSERSWEKGCLALLSFFTLTRLPLIALGDLKVEEAYYWDYSQHPSLSYFDHPPMVAWLIGLSTSALGHFPFAVRLPALLLFLLSSILLGRLAQQMFGPRAAFFTLLLLNSIPAFTAQTLVILPDAPLLFFWSVGLYAGWQLISQDQPRWWWVVGVATGLGLDSKYPALLIPLGIFLCGPRRLVLTPAMVGSAALAILLFTPVLLWNAQHEFASFLFQGGERMGQAVSLKEKIGSWVFQLGLVSPGAFVAMGVALVWAWRRREQQAVRYLLCWCLPFLALMVFVSTRRLVQINWPLPAYIAAVVIMGGWLDSLSPTAPAEPSPTFRVAYPTGWLLAIFGMAFSFSTLWWLPLAAPLAIVNPVDDINQWQPFGQRAREVRNAMPDPEHTFLAAPGYQAAAELAYTSGLPQITLSSNLLGERAVSFTYWAAPANFAGWDAVLANYAQPTSRGDWRERVPLDLEKYQARFERVEGPETIVVERGGKPLRRYQYYRCFRYRPPGGGPPGGEQRAEPRRPAADAPSRVP